MTKKKFLLIIISCFILVSCSNLQKRESSETGIKISEIQGCGHFSPFEGKAIEGMIGIVTAKYNNGFYLQDQKPDSQPCTSEAIFIFTGNFPDVLPGDEVEVSGSVKEHIPGDVVTENLPITEIVDPVFRVLSKNNPLPDAIEIGNNGLQIPETIIDDDDLKIFDVENDGIDFYESIESMLVKVSDGVVVGPRNQYNEVVINAYTSRIEREAGIVDHLSMTNGDFNPERLILNLSKINADPINNGDKLAGPVIGILDYSYGNYKINVFGKVIFNQVEHQYSSLELNSDYLSIASYNTNNLSFYDENARFVDLARVITGDLQSPDILILHEIMDDSGEADDGKVAAEKTIEKILNNVNSSEGPEYDSMHLDPHNNQSGGIPGGNIRSVTLFRKDRGIQPVNGADDGTNLINPDQIGVDSGHFFGSRKPLVSVFIKNDQKFMVIATHLTSRGADSPWFGIHQPILEPELNKRSSQAQEINRFVNTVLTEDPTMPIIVAGDMNDYPWSKTLSALKGGELLDLGDTLPADDRFTYILDGNAFQIDYILVSKNCYSQDNRFSILHLNSIVDHTFQSSDHDAVFAEIGLFQ